MPLNKKRVAIYLRKSRADEPVEALANHKAVLERLAANKGMEYDIYEEIGSSVHLDWREKYDEMLSKLDQYSHVLVMDIDRLARDLVAMDTIKKQFIYHDVKILTPSQEIDLSNMNQEMMLDFQSVVAKAEYQMIKKRMRIGKVEGARRGHWVNGVAPLGYTYNRETKKLIINEDEYPLVKEIFSLALNNMSYMEIAINLNLRGFKTRRGNMFDNHSIKAILTNRAYVGYVIYREASKVKGQEGEVTITPNAHPEIISESEWLEIQQLIQNRRTNIGKTATEVRSFVQGLIYCGCCGGKLSLNSIKGELYIKGCSKMDGLGNKCPNKSVKVKELEDFLKINLMTYRNKLEEKAKQLLNTDTSAIKQELTVKGDMIKAEIEKHNNVLSRLLDSYLDGIISKDIYQAKQKERQEQIKILENDSRSIELQIEGLDVNKQVDKIKDLILTLNTFDSLDVTLANRILMTLVNRIDVTVLSSENSVYRRNKTEAEYSIKINTSLMKVD